MEPITIADIALRLTGALLVGIVLGIERSVAHKNAGMRTYGLVSMGSCLFVVISLYVLPQFSGFYSIDPFRLAAGVVTGIGFLGAGLIFQKDNTLSGLTTAAGLWVACGTGIAMGFGLYEIAVIAVLLALVTFTILWFIEKAVVSIGDKTKRTIIHSKEE